MILQGVFTTILRVPFKGVYKDYYKGYSGGLISGP